MSQEERDLLIRMDQNLSNLVDRLTDHIHIDDSRHEQNLRSIDFLRRAVYIGMGGLSVLSIILKLLVK